MRQAYDYWQNQPGNYLKSSVARPRGAFTPSHTPPPVDRGGDQDIYKVGGRAEAQRPTRETPGAEAAERSPRVIQLPPLSSPRDGPGQTWGFATLNVGPHCTIRPSVGGYQPPATWAPPCNDMTGSHGCRLRLTPECLRIMIAIGQSSTDSFRAHRPKSMSLQATLVRPYPLLGVVSLGYSGRVKRPSPGPEPTAASRAHAVQITRPTVDGPRLWDKVTPPTGRFKRTGDLRRLPLSDKPGRIESDISRRAPERSTPLLR